MTYRGRIAKGVVVLEPGVKLPEGAEVAVLLETNGAASPGELEPTIGQKLASLARSMEGQPCDLPTDLAAQHDHYLHGLPKR